MVCLLLRAQFLNLAGESLVLLSDLCEVIHHLCGGGGGGGGLAGVNLVSTAQRVEGSEQIAESRAQSAEGRELT
jgi:hypothetical protein